MNRISKRIDNATHVPSHFLSGCPPPPHAVKIELMRSCNYRCEFCHHSALDHKTGAMEMDLYRKIVVDLAGLDVQELAPFFFGESSL